MGSKLEDIPLQAKIFIVKQMAVACVSRAIWTPLGWAIGVQI